jgi:curved DNA-binding protein CbpA
MKTAYDELGVRPDADYEAIKAAYLNAAKLHHPDMNVSKSAAEARFKRISAAHDILKRPSRRAAYDQLLRYRHRLMRRERIVAIASFAGCCLVGVALAIGNAHLLQRWPLGQQAPMIPVTPVFEAQKAATAAIPISAADRQISSRSENGGTVAAPASDMRPPEPNMPANAPGWRSSSQPPSRPDPTTAMVGDTTPRPTSAMVGDIRSSPTRPMADQSSAGASASIDETWKRDRSHNAVQVASRASNAGAALEATHLRRTRTTIPVRRTVQRRRPTMRNHRPLRSFDNAPGAEIRLPRRHVLIAPRYYRMINSDRWSGPIFCPLH